MITIHAQLMDREGHELDARDVHGHTYSAVIKTAIVWGGGALRRTDDPDAYVLHTFTQSKSKEAA